MKKYPAICEDRKRGDEVIHTGEDNPPVLKDFWRWAYSGLLINVSRGVLAEFLVANALGIADGDSIRNEWEPYDLKSKKCTKIEVKSAAYIQTWGQCKLSRISFNIAKTKEWNQDSGKHEGPKKRHSHVYVFCLISETSQAEIDPPLRVVDHWKFYVVNTCKLNRELGEQKTLSLSRLEGLARQVRYDELKNAVEEERGAGSSG